MPKNTPQKDVRVSVEVPDDVAPDFAELVERLGVSKGGLAALAVRFVIPALKSGELVQLNGKIVPNPTAKAA